MLRRRRTTWLGGTGALLLALSLSGVVAGAAPPEADPAVVDTTATFEDLDGNGIDDDCQDAAAVADPAATAAELLTVDVDADGTISTTEAAHSDRVGGENCNHGGYVSWVAHENGDCVAEPTVADTTVIVPVVTEPEDTEPALETCEPEAEPVITASKKDKVTAAAARAASKAERTLAREARTAERTLARETRKAEAGAAREAKRAERHAAREAKKAERAAANAAKPAKAKTKGH